MGMTMTQKILASHAGLDSVEVGELINVKLDMVLANDITGPVSINEFEKSNFAEVFDRDRITLVMDHFVPNKDIKSAEQCKQCRSFAKRFDISNFYDVGEMGIEHALLPEKGLVAPGEAIIGADSHTCTYGALGAFSTGVGSTDVAAAMATGEARFKVPSAIKFHLRGELKPYVSGKDVILHIIGMIGVDGALYKSMEFTGPGVSSLSMDDRLTIANMAIEAGAKNGIFPVDDVTKKYLKGRVNRVYSIYEADPDANYDAIYDIDLSEIVPTVSFPHLPDNTRTFTDIPKIEIDQVVIGSCTNGRFSDMKAAWEIIKGRHIAKGIRAILIPATMQVYKECLQKGYIEDFIDAGFVVSTPTCGPCLGGYMGILASGEKCVSTTNRNFVGRMGATDSEIYLASPAVAAASALMGVIADPRIVDSKSERKAEKKTEKKLEKAERLAEKAEKAAAKAETAAVKASEKKTAAKTTATKKTSSKKSDAKKTKIKKTSKENK
ncbi:MAG: 3-isopropylmalate dehydratase large subunit [Firmicutes bacterium]|nr:3-isopropylmalate dehydratase large subunit [Bacillota bacterium]